jgi:DNA-binding response OmpR family regulator
VLLVDDNRVLATSLARRLERAGARVSTANSTASGRTALASADHDLLVTDLQLGDGLGTELIRAMDASDHPARVIVITGAPDELGRVAIGADHRVAAILTKPFSGRDLLAAVSAALRRG